MRLTPAQLGVHLICGADWLPRFSRMPLRQRLEEGRDLLRQITGKDFVYDLPAWHNYLKESRDGGYTWGRNIVLPKIMQAAVASEEWQQTAEILSRKA